MGRLNSLVFRAYNEILQKNSNLVFRAILDTPPIATDPNSDTLLITILDKPSYRAYLLAAKSLLQYCPPIRVVVQNDGFVATVPFFARYPYEVHITARRPGVSALTDMDRKEQRDLATILKTILGKYDNLFGFSLPYMMVLHQRPTTGGADEFPHYQFHIEFYPPYRTKDKLKYLAGSESGAGAYINDTLAEEKAAELRALEPKSA